MIAPPFVVKVCGVTTREDAQAALDAGANALGFNFYPKSPRYVSVESAAEIIGKLNGDYLRVGVFVNPASADFSFLDVVQIHGSAPGTRLPVWKGVAAGEIPLPDSSAAAWLLDTPSETFGGSGKTINWSVAAAFPYRKIVAGGLDSGNVAAAIRIAKPWGVDACSRLELTPGRKDHRRVAAFVAEARAAFQAEQVVNI